MKYQGSFSLKNNLKMKSKLLSAAVVIGALIVKCQILCSGKNKRISSVCPLLN